MPVRRRVSQGECLAGIAFSYGFHWRTIFQHSLNADLRRARPNPNTLYPGDEVSVPERELKEVERPTDSRHRFVASGQRTRLRIRLQDREGEPYENARYSLRAGGIEYEGRTGSDGMVEQYIPADADHADLYAWLRLSPDDPEEEFYWSLAPGSLDPLETVSGVQARLNNLGFLCGKVDGVAGPRTRRALRAFQSTEQIEVTGEIDGATRARLRSVHDGED